MEATSLRFAAAARALGRGARRAELTVPGFRSPPRLSGVDRSLRRRGDTATVAIRLRGRPWMAVVSDMVEGVVAANLLEGPLADQARAQLWSSLETDGLLPPPPPAPPGRPVVVPPPVVSSRPASSPPPRLRARGRPAAPAHRGLRRRDPPAHGGVTGAIVTQPQDGAARRRTPVRARRRSISSTAPVWELVPG